MAGRRARGGLPVFRRAGVRPYSAAPRLLAPSRHPADHGGYAARGRAGLLRQRARGDSEHRPPRRRGPGLPRGARPQRHDPPVARQHPDGPIPLRPRRPRQRRVPARSEDADARDLAQVWRILHGGGDRRVSARRAVRPGPRVRHLRREIPAGRQRVRFPRRRAPGFRGRPGWRAAGGRTTPGARVFSGCTSTIAIFRTSRRRTLPRGTRRILIRAKWRAWTRRSVLSSRTCGRLPRRSSSS